MIGPFSPERPEGDELLPLPPSRWYLTGFLSPAAGREIEVSLEDEELGAGSELEGDEEAAGAEPEPKQRNRYPASMGMSVLLPAGSSGDKVVATVSYAEYIAEGYKESEGEKPRQVWRRIPREPVNVEVPLDAKKIAAGIPVPDTSGIYLRGKLGPAQGHGLPSGTRALSLFVVNERSAGERGRQDEQFLFQVRLELFFEAGFVPRPNRQGEKAKDWDDRVGDLQFRDHCEFSVGHGVSVEVRDPGDPVRRVRTTWLPRCEVRRVVTREERAVVTDMESLAELGADAVKGALSPLIEAYGKWIETERAVDVGTDRRAEVRDELMRRAEEAKARIAEGIELLARDGEALEAFRLANRAMATAARRRNPERYRDGGSPSWHLFQIAFLLLNVASIAEPKNRFRENVELIFFPTGGGKTEAYLAIIAFTLLLRRLRGVSRPDGGLGVAVLLRYTLRLLTLDQLGRAATLMCALEGGAGRTEAGAEPAGKGSSRAPSLGSAGRGSAVGAWSLAGE